MSTRRGRMLAGLVTVVASTAIAGGVVASTQSSDEAALAPNRGAPSRDIEKRIDSLLRKMTLEDKLNQIQLLSDGQITDAEARKPVGGVFSLTEAKRIN
jgi:beta-glucosidase